MSKPKFPKDFGKVSSKKADVFGNKFESLAHHAEDRPDLPSEWGSMERAERVIPDDLRELYESDATWDGALMVKFANSHGLIHRGGNVELMIRKYLIERIARAARQWANARLIAAAPDLLTAAKAALPLVEAAIAMSQERRVLAWGYTATVLDREIEAGKAVIAQLQAAIGKAEG